MTGSAALQSVVVIGGGSVALSAAIAVRRALPACTVTLLVSDTPLGPTDRIGAGSAALLDFHDQIGLDHAQFLKRCGGALVTEQRWQGLAPVRAADAIPFHDGVALHQLWLAQAQTVDRSDWANFASDERDASFGIRFDPQRYRQLLGDFARHLGIAMPPVGEWSVSLTESAQVAAITAAEGACWTADFFIDATSTPSPVLRALGAAWTDWSTRLPARGVAALIAPLYSSSHDALLQAATTLDWHSPAWSARFDDAATAPTPGRLSVARAGNALALGDAALAAESFDGLPLGIACRDIMRALTLLPGRVPSPREAAEYARQTAIIHDQQGDWAAARWLGPDGTQTMALPPGLDDMLSQFTERGRVPVRDMDPVPPGFWLSWFIALGITPRRIDPTARAVAPALTQQILQAAAARSLSSRS
jgi:tryptophan 7-halogenase